MLPASIALLWLAEPDVIVERSVHVRAAVDDDIIILAFIVELLYAYVFIVTIPCSFWFGAFYILILFYEFSSLFSPPKFGEFALLQTKTYN